MSREASIPRTVPVSVGRPAPNPITDGVVTIRPPESADVEILARYASDESLLEGSWAGWPTAGVGAGEWAGQRIREWQSGWTPEGSTESGALIIDECERFVGVLIFVPTPANSVELVYGIVPHARGRGVASRAARLGADWALIDAGFDRVELRISQDHAVSQRVAEKAGFRFFELFETYVTGTGETHVDTLYVRTAEDGAD